MLKKVLCMGIIAVMIIATCVVGAGAAEVETAQTNVYAKSLIMGDVDLDGEISVIDASVLQTALAGKTELSDDQWLVSNTTKNEYPTVMDATEIQKYIAGLECRGCTGETVKTPENENKPSDDIQVSIKDTESIERAIAKRFIEYVNEERTKVGVQPLSTNVELTKAAGIRSEEIIGTFSHTRPDGTSCYTAIENTKNYGMMGENIAMNAGILSFFDPDTLESDIDYAARFFFGQFKSSKGHYENMIRESFDTNGVGVTIVVRKGYAECYLAHMFAQTVK